MAQTKKYQLVTIGGATRDIVFYSSDGELISTGDLTKQKLLAFEYGAKIMADKVYFSFGGGAVNVAVAAAMLGLSPAAICHLGNDENGRLILNNLKSKAVSTELVGIDRKTATGFSMILTTNNPAKEHIAFLYRGANNDLSAGDLKLKNFSTDWFYLASLPKEGWEGIVREVVGSKKEIAWNPGASQLKQLEKLKKFLPKIKVLILNRDEASEFRKLKNIKSLLSYIHGLGPKIVVITDGAAGAYVYDGKKYYFMKARSTKTVNTIGVGDAFGAAFMAALVAGKDIKTALAWGIRNSASVTTKIGAQDGLLTRRQILR